MTISVVDIKILWGKSGGRCAYPGCNEDLISLLTNNGRYVVGEMAHIIGSKPTAPRGISSGGADTYDNLILLCPTHHTHIDKAPVGTYTVETILEWKHKHESIISNLGLITKFDNVKSLHFAIASLLSANKVIFDTFGPNSDLAQRDPSSNSFLVWELRRIDTIIPNNRKMLELLDANIGLIENIAEINAIEKFRAHVESYEKHVHCRLDFYLLFPKEFLEVFS